MVRFQWCEIYYLLTDHVLTYCFSSTSLETKTRQMTEGVLNNNIHCPAREWHWSYKAGSCTYHGQQMGMEWTYQIGVWMHPYIDVTTYLLFDISTSSFAGSIYLLCEIEKENTDRPLLQQSATGNKLPNSSKRQCPGISCNFLKIMTVERPSLCPPWMCRSTAYLRGPIRVKFWQATWPWNHDIRLDEMATNDTKIS